MTTRIHLKEEDGIARIEFDHPEKEVNLLDTVTMLQLQEVLCAVQKRTDLFAVLVTSAKPKIFIAGADIHEIEGLTDREQMIEKTEGGKAILRMITDIKVPTIAVINGACLGGGFELALACKYRVASFSDGVKIGLPEVQLGILPGFGGTLRLPKLIGIVKALPLILAGKVVGAKEALKSGLVDRLFPEKTLLFQAIEFAKALISGQEKVVRQPLPWFFEKTPLGRMLVYHTAKKNALKQTRGFYPAPLKVIEVVRKSYRLSVDQGSRIESEGFADLAGTEVSKCLIRLYFLNERYKKFPWTDLKLRPEPVLQAGVIGAGVMGGGVAQLLSNRNIPVRVKDINTDALGGALREAYRLYSESVRKKRMKPFERDRKMCLISAGLTQEGMRRCGFIIEAVVEDLGIKQKVFRELGEITGSGTILASNTSSLSINEIAKVTSHPERVIGLHFFNPVNRMPLVEVIPADVTNQETIERTVQFARELGKTVIIVKDVRGFLVNRILVPYLNEAGYLMEEGVSPQQIDSVAKRFGMPMGPGELLDHIGIDIGFKVAHILEVAYGTRMKVAPILERLKSKGFHGKKISLGLYRYKGKKMTPNAGLDLPKPARDISDEEILKRLIYIMINEASRCLEEKVATEAGVVDIGMIMGTGFPPFRAGLLRYADDTGLKNIAEDLGRLAASVDRGRFAVAPLLARLASNGQTFYPS
ncbi:MAG: 3-hydroxyacyl-CoA dehydrogenase NAD-binding domain-containing protein [Candidatus Omnitrophota bacterium]